MSKCVQKTKNRGNFTYVDVPSWPVQVHCQPARSTLLKFVSSWVPPVARHARRDIRRQSGWHAQNEVMGVVFRGVLRLPSAVRTNAFFEQPLRVHHALRHEDEGYRDELEKHLALLERNGVVEEWYDRKIAAGSEWAGEIGANLEQADVVLLVVSASFLASDYCYDKAMKRAMERHESRQARVIPVILRPVDNWHTAPFGKLQACPTNGTPVTKWDDRDVAFADVARCVREAVEELAANESQVPGTVGTAMFQVPPPNPYFQGRGQDLAKLHRQLNSTRRAALGQPAAISGLGGIGKTQAQNS